MLAAITAGIGVNVSARSQVDTGLIVSFCGSTNMCTTSMIRTSTNGYAHAERCVRVVASADGTAVHGVCEEAGGRAGTAMDVDLSSSLLLVY